MVCVDLYPPSGLPLGPPSFAEKATGRAGMARRSPRHLLRLQWWRLCLQTRQAHSVPEMLWSSQTPHMPPIYLLGPFPGELTLSFTYIPLCPSFLCCMCLLPWLQSTSFHVVFTPLNNIAMRRHPHHLISRACSML